MAMLEQQAKAVALRAVAYLIRTKWPAITEGIAKAGEINRADLKRVEKHAMKEAARMDKRVDRMHGK